MYLVRNLTRRLAQFSSGFSKYTTAMAEAGTIDFDEVRSGLENKSFMYVDVRNRSELVSDGQIVGSVNLPLPEIVEAIGSNDSEFKTKYGFDKPEKNADLVVGCLAGKRAAAAGEQLLKLGFSNIKIYPGSFNDWRGKGGPISKE